MAGKDWVEVKLTRFGEEHSQGGQLRVQEGNGGKGFVFLPGESQRVTRAFDWEQVLRPWHINGHALFEQVFSQAYEEKHAAQLDGPGVQAVPTPSGIEVIVSESEVEKQ
jgi:hypothetical protein